MIGFVTGTISDFVTEAAIACVIVSQISNVTIIWMFPADHLLLPTSVFDRFTVCVTGVIYVWLVLSSRSWQVCWEQLVIHATTGLSKNYSLPLWTHINILSMSRIPTLRRTGHWPGPGKEEVPTQISVPRITPTLSPPQKVWILWEWPRLITDLATVCTVSPQSVTVGILLSEWGCCCPPITLCT